MAVEFSSSFSTLFTTQTYNMFTNNFAVTVYTGIMPTPLQIINNWTTYNQSSSLCLWHASNGCTWQILSNTILNAINIPSARAPFRDGAATWFIAWTDQVSSVNVLTIPSTVFMLGDVSGLFGNGVMKFQEIGLLVATPTTFTEMNFRFTYTG